MVLQHLCQKNLGKQGPWKEYGRVAERFYSSFDASENFFLALHQPQENFAKNIAPYEAYLAAVSLHNRRPSSISASKIPHLTENFNWFRVKV